jgi:hypothetical protein
MQDREPGRIKRLLDTLLAVRARRDAEPRWSERWHALDAELHRIERAIFRFADPDDSRSA